MRYEFLKNNQGNYNIRRACKVLKISRGGFYSYLKRKPSARQIANEFLVTKIKEVFEKHESRYGALRISLELKDEGIIANHKKVARLMRANGLYALGARRHYKNYCKRNRNMEKPNLLNRVFESDKKNKIWLGDMTYIPTREGFLYLAVVLDVFSRKISGWAMGKRMNEALVMDALRQAVGKEHPPKGFIVHTDQGSQYTGRNFRALVTSFGGCCSNSRRGNPYDNAMMESFYRTFKRELIDEKNYKNREEAMHDVFKYIELYYNPIRKHSGLGYVSPRQFEKIHSS